MNKAPLLFLTLCITLLNIGATYADDPFENYAQVHLIPETTTVQPGDDITIATAIKLAPSWHVYWQNPGDSGLPVRIKWSAPDGFALTEILWPTPEKISYDILVNYGYYNTVTLLQTLKVPAKLPEGKITLTASIEMLVCHDICIPETHSLSLTFNDPNAPKHDHSTLINSAASKIPQPLEGEFYYTEKAGQFILTAKPHDPSILKEATPKTLEFFPLDRGIINLLSPPDVTRKKEAVTLSYERGDQSLSKRETLKGLLVITSAQQGQNRGFTITATPRDLINAPPHNRQTNKLTWLRALYLALFGGLILNLMPCVFPVLSMKALSLVKMSRTENKHARAQGIAYTLGVMICFLAVGATLLILKEAGAHVGWGFQLQNPVIVALLAYLLFVIGLNLMGFFEVKAAFSNIGHTLTRGKSLSSSFFTGMLTTIVATPCTAPFMGAAMGFAITQPAFISMSIFAALGFGLALPYLLLSCIPPLRRILPKPGAWMDVFKQFLAFPIFASTIWLIWVLSQQAGSYGVLLVLSGMLAIVFCVWLAHLKSKNIGKHFTSVLLVLALCLPFFSLSYIKSADEEINRSENTYMFGETFSNEKLTQLLQGDDPVFVEMTAAWCITCKLNHAIALNIDTTKNLFKAHDVQYLIGDWTNHNDSITRYLNGFDRDGVPLYVFYGKRDAQTNQRPAPILLPQILTVKTLEDMLL